MEKISKTKKKMPPMTICHTVTNTHYTMRKKRSSGSNNKVKGQVWLPRDAAYAAQHTWWFSRAGTWFSVPPMFFILILINQSKKINLPLMVLKITKKNLFESMKKLLDPWIAFWTFEGKCIFSFYVN
jgi:hypothetical protein